MARGWLTPDDLGADCCLLIPWKQGIFAHLLGAIREMTYLDNWQQFGTLTPEQVTQYIMGAMLLIDNNCETPIRAIRVNAETGQLETSSDGINWLPVPSNTGMGYSVITDNSSIINNLYALPTDFTYDKYCSAAWILAQSWADDLQDFMEIVDAVATVTAETIENFGDALVGWIPVLSAVVAVFEWLHEGLLQVVIDWVRENAMDVDAIHLAAREIYCAIMKCLDAQDNLRHWHNYVVYPSYITGGTSFALLGGKPTWQNFKPFLQAIFDTLTSSAAGWAIVAYGGFISWGLDQLYPSENYIEKAVGYAAASGRQLTGFDCSGDCQFCTTFNQDNFDGWKIYQGQFAPIGCDNNPGVTNGGSGAIELRVKLPGHLKVTSIHWRDHHDAGTLDVLVRTFLDGVLVQTINQFQGAGGAQNCLDVQFTGLSSACDEVRFYFSSDTSITWSEFTVCWS